MTTAPTATAADITANPYHRYSNLALGDAAGDNDVVLKAATARQAQIREVMDFRQLSILEGARFTVTKDVKPEKRFDSKAAKATMGAAWYAQFQKPGTRTTYTVMARPPEQLGVAP